MDSIPELPIPIPIAIPASNGDLSDTNDVSTVTNSNTNTNTNTSNNTLKCNIMNQKNQDTINTTTSVVNTTTITTTTVTTISALTSTEIADTFVATTTLNLVNSNSDNNFSHSKNHTSDDFNVVKNKSQNTTRHNNYEHHYHHHNHHQRRTKNDTNNVAITTTTIARPISSPFDDRYLCLTHPLAEEKVDAAIIKDLRPKSTTDASLSNSTYILTRKPDNMTLMEDMDIIRKPNVAPPKPPMLSRTPSIGISGTSSETKNDEHKLETTTTTLQNNEHLQTTTTTITTAIAAIANYVPPHDVPPHDAPNKATTVAADLKLEIVPCAPSAPIAENISVDITTPLTPTMSINNERRISNASNVAVHSKIVTLTHYERLIEELKCPGCALPMKGPIVLCKTGHSICEQCTRVLLMCPLCKENFTDMRSRTIEALCSKAHFRCINSNKGCTVRLQLDLLKWHERQCMYKPMKCFMGRVWEDCDWTGREIDWKEHLELEHSKRVFACDTKNLIWNMGIKQKSLSGYYVFQVFDEMFNFYEIYDRERVLFTMTCTSTMKEKKHNFAYSVLVTHVENEALSMTQTFPVHSEYDQDILAEGTCVSIPVTDLAKFMDDERVLHYNVKILQVKSPRNLKASRKSSLQNVHAPDFQQTQIAGVNLKNVPSDNILTRKIIDDIPYADMSASPTSGDASGFVVSEDELQKNLKKTNGELNDSDQEQVDVELEAFIAKRWGTPQMNFNRRFLKPTSSESSSNDDSFYKYKNHSTMSNSLKRNKKGAAQKEQEMETKTTNDNYKKKIKNLRKSFRNLSNMSPFTKKSPEKKNYQSD